MALSAATAGIFSVLAVGVACESSRHVHVSADNGVQLSRTAADVQSDAMYDA